MNGDALGHRYAHAVWQIKFDVSDRAQKHDALGRIRDGEHWVVAPTFLSRKGREGWQVVSVTMHPNPAHAGSLLVFARRLEEAHQHREE